MSLKLSNEQFINKSKAVHGNLYDYSNVNYINNDLPVKIGCSEHGYFHQRPNSHLIGRKCPDCSHVDRRISPETFLNRCKSVHGDKFLYDRMSFTTTRTKVTIGCPRHGYFEQHPYAHLGGVGCKQCAIEQISNGTEVFINRSKLIHGDKYAYDKVIYKNAHSKLTITCPTHGDFNQVANYHLRGNGCPRCSESKGEKYLAATFDTLNINYIRQFKLPDYRYLYDFYLPDYDIYIEYNGVQHYKPMEVFGGRKGFRKTVRRDKAKIELVKRSTGILIIISYKFNTLNKIEDELLRLFSLLHPDFLKDKEAAKRGVVDSNFYLINNGIGYFRKRLRSNSKVIHHRYTRLSVPLASPELLCCV